MKRVARLPALGCLFSFLACGACCEDSAPPAFKIETVSVVTPDSSKRSARVSHDGPSAGCLLQRPGTLLEPIGSHRIVFGDAIRDARSNYSVEIPDVGNLVFAKQSSSEKEGVTQWRGVADDGERLGYRIAEAQIEGEIQTTDYFFRFSSEGRSGHPEIDSFRVAGYAARNTCDICHSTDLPQETACVEPTSPLQDVLVLVAVPVGPTGKGCDEDCRRQVCDNVEKATEIYRDEIYPSGGGRLDVWIQRFAIKDNGIRDSLANLHSHDDAYSAIFRFRDCLGADIVAVASPINRGGTACFATDAEHAFASIGVGERSGDHTLAHEVSHVLGAGHQQLDGGALAGCRFGQFGYAWGGDLMIAEIGSRRFTTPNDDGVRTASDRDSYNNPCLVRMNINTAASFRKPPPPAASCRAQVHHFVSHQSCMAFLANETQGVT